MGGGTGRSLGVDGVIRGGALATVGRDGRVGFGVALGVLGG